VLVDDPVHDDVPERLAEIRRQYDAHYAEAVAVSLDEARHRERRGTAAGAAKIRGRLRAERARRQAAEARLGEGQRTKRLLGQIFGRSRSGNRDATSS
jgi:hypothetical protein